MEGYASVTFGAETWEVIREHLWLGTGPGNFRDYYLKYKLPESSEEIADPHNFVFDVWANTGLLGLTGLLACVTLLGLTGRGRQRDDVVEAVEPESRENSNCCWTSAAVWGAGCLTGVRLCRERVPGRRSVQSPTSRVAAAEAVAMRFPMDCGTRTRPTSRNSSAQP